MFRAKNFGKEPWKSLELRAHRIRLNQFQMRLFENFSKKGNPTFRLSLTLTAGTQLVSKKPEKI